LELVLRRRVGPRVRSESRDLDRLKPDSSKRRLKAERKLSALTEQPSCASAGSKMVRRFSYCGWRNLKDVTIFLSITGMRDCA